MNPNVSAEASRTVPACPERIPQDWLAPAAHPRVFCTKQGLAAARQTVKHTAWGGQYLQRQKRISARFVKMTPPELRALVPPAGCKIIYGLGMNLDPVYGKRMRWGGWNHPFTVTDVKGRTYPNEDWPDKGDGVPDPKTGQRFYFLAQAYGHVLKQLETKVLPALADVYALDGSIEHARTAAVILDAVAAIYPTNRRGPMDYPTSAADMDRGGRLTRPYYQTARGLMNYGFVIDILAASGELEKPSAAKPNQSIRENVIRNLLWDGSAYCLDFAKRGYALHNGHADYVRGAALAGLLLDVPEFADPMLHGPLSIYAMLAINIDRNGFYYETSPSYATHARHLYVTIAELVEAAIRLGWKDVRSVYSIPAMRLLLTEPYDRREVGGHVPAVGDDGPDRFVHDPLRRRPQGGYVHSDRFIKAQLESAWVRLVRGSDAADRRAAAQLIRDSFGPGTDPQPEPTRWSIYHIDLEAIERVQALPPDAARFETASVMYGAKGLAILRGGKGGNRHGAQLFFGPINNHGQPEALSWTFFARGAEWSFDPGYFNTHYRFGWTTQTVSHQALVVDQRSCPVNTGAGYLLSWYAGRAVQWAMAAHPAAYASQGVTRYERLIAQVQGPDGGLGYWLDVSRVVGGQTRDDSFHTQMQQAKLDVDLPPPDPNRPSLYGDRNFGDMLRDDMRLKGFDDKPFYWAPDGDGYGFLGNPRQVEMPGTVRAVLGRPAFARKLDGVIVADLDGTPGRTLIVADSPKLGSNAPRVVYLLRRDTGDRPSVFAKLIRLAETAEDDAIAGFGRARLVGDTAGLAGAWVVGWADGRRDLWVVGHGTKLRAEVAGLPPVETDAKVAVIRFDASGRPRSLIATSATTMSIKSPHGPVTLHGQPAELLGRVESVDPDQSPASLKVVWTDGTEQALRAAEADGPVAVGEVAITMPPIGQPATWRIAAFDAQAGRVTVAGVKASLAVTDFLPIPDKPGWYRMLSGVSRFYSAGSRPNRNFAIGKPVYRAGRMIGRIAELADDARSIRIVANHQPVAVKQRFTGTILEAGPGDRIVVPLLLRWRAVPPSDR